ncbi:MAG: nucleotidyltransferase domain-containing protein [Sedimentisphaerales bacterium]|nr:nucleotidyltransferase domain-containing protein [Sedimentisphaerales bacterium]
MDKATVLKVAAFGRALEAERIKPEKIILFGFYSTQTQRPDSDIDLVVISEDFAGKGYWQRIDVLAAAICKVFEPIEAVAMTPEEWRQGDSLIADYARNGEVVYGTMA